MWELIQSRRRGATWIHEDILDLDDLANKYDAIVVCAGASTVNLLGQASVLNDATTGMQTFKTPSIDSYPVGSTTKTRQSKQTLVDGKFPENARNSLYLPLKLDRGQNVYYHRSNTSRYEWPSEGNAITRNHSDHELRHPILSGEYVVPDLSHPGSLIAGATHEHHDSLADLRKPPDLSRALNLLSEKVNKLYPPLQVGYSPVYARSGVRVNSVRSHLGKV